MKKALLFGGVLAGAIALASCTKQADTIRPYATITIGLSPGPASGTFPTKGIAEEIAATLPERMALSLTDKASGQSYEVQTGTQIRLPIGTYSVAGATSPAVRQEVYGTTHYTSAEPLVVVEDELAIEQDRANYSVTAQYRCFVLAVDSSEAGAWSVRSNGEWATMEKSTASGLWWTFVVGDYDAAHPLRTMVTGTDGSGLDYTFHTSSQPGGVLAEYGRWYLLRRGSSTPQSGGLALVLPGWSAGN